MKKTLPLSPFHAGSFPGRVSPLDLVCMKTSSFYQGTTTIDILDTYTHYQGTTIYIDILDTYTHYQGTTIYILYIYILSIHYYI